MRAVAASRKLGKRHDSSNFEKTTGSNGGAASGGARQKIANQKALNQKKKEYSSTSLYTAVPTSPLDSAAGGNRDTFPTSTSMITTQSRMSMAPPGSNKQDGKKTPDQRTTTPMSSQSLDLGDARVSSPNSVTSNGPKKYPTNELMPRTVSNLSRAPSSVATTNIGAASKVESVVGARRRAVEKRYYAKAMGLMICGGVIFSVGIAFAALYFADYKDFLIAGPIAISVGLLLFVFGIVWIPIIKTKLKRQQQIMSRTFSL